MSDFEFRVEGSRGATWREVIDLADEAEARVEGALLVSQLIRDEAASLTDGTDLAVMVTVTDLASLRAFALEFFTRAVEPSDSRPLQPPAPGR